MYFKHQKYSSFSVSEPNYFSQSAFGHPVQSIRTQNYHVNNKNILEYAQIVATHGNSRILDFEGHSRKYAKVQQLMNTFPLQTSICDDIPCIGMWEKFRCPNSGPNERNQKRI